MRVLESFLWFMVAVGLVCWYVFYLWIMSLNCAFGSARGNCITIWPWELRGEDLWLLILIPGSLITGLVGAALLTRSPGSIVARLMLAPAVLIGLMFAVFAFI